MSTTRTYLSTGNLEEMQGNSFLIQLSPQKHSQKRMLIEQKKFRLY